MKNDNFDINALFLGPKSENGQFFKDALISCVDDHLFWRKDFHPEDEPIISYQEKKCDSFQNVQDRTLSVLDRLSALMRETSAPWHSPRYLGHMNSEVLMASILGYVTAVFYNANNCAYEGSPATTPMELEVGMDLCRLLGYDTSKSWGHITCDGTIANMEGLWYARNISSLPFAIQAVRPELVAGKTDWELANMTVDQILDLAQKVKDVWEDVRNNSVRGLGVQESKLGKWIVPQSKHYSWVKAADVLGIGLQNVVDVQVDNHFRMDIDVLEQTINDLVEKQIPILGVVAVIGTTEEGAIDYLDKVVALREKFQKEKGVSFYIHADAAYGGYARSIFLDEENRFMEYDELVNRLHAEGIIDNDIVWPPKDVYNAYKALEKADSITIDPHKMGYVPYAAGGIVIKDKRMVDSISFFAAYVFEAGTTSPMLLGSYIMEGSKAGASAASVWVAHQLIPLNITGYGKLIGASINGAHLFYNMIAKTKTIEVNGKTVRLEALVNPDFNMVDFAFNPEGNTDLNYMNEINLKLWEQSSATGVPILKKDFVTSHTDLAYEDYKDAPENLALRLGVTSDEWNKVKSIRVLRACILSPYLGLPKVTEQYWDDFMESMKKKLSCILK